MIAKLQAAGSKIDCAYQKADQGAKWQLNLHRVLAQSTAILGTIAVLLAVGNSKPGSTSGTSGALH